jgi:hypothetical protein
MHTHARCLITTQWFEVLNAAAVFSYRRCVPAEYDYTNETVHWEGGPAAGAHSHSSNRLQWAGCHCLRGASRPLSSSCSQAIHRLSMAVCGAVHGLFMAESCRQFLARHNLPRCASFPSLHPAPRILSHCPKLPACPCRRPCIQYCPGRNPGRAATQHWSSSPLSFCKVQVHRQARVGQDRRTLGE